MTSPAQVPEREPDDETARKDDDEQRSSSPPDELVDPYAEEAAREQLLGPGDDPD